MGLIKTGMQGAFLIGAAKMVTSSKNKHDKKKQSATLEDEIMRYSQYSSFAPAQSPGIDANQNQRTYAYQGQKQPNKSPAPPYGWSHKPYPETSADKSREDSAYPPESGWTYSAPPRDLQ